MGPNQVNVSPMDIPARILFSGGVPPSVPLHCFMSYRIHSSCSLVVFLMSLPQFVFNYVVYKLHMCFVDRLYQFPCPVLLCERVYGYSENKFSI